MKRRIERVKFGSPCPYCGCTDKTQYEGVKKKKVTSVRKGRSVPAFYVTRYTSCCGCGERRLEFRTEFPQKNFT